MFPIHVPPLRERPEDIPLLVWRFVEEFARAFGKRIDSIDRDDFAALQRYALARQHPRAAQRRRARDDRRHRPAPGDCPSFRSHRQAHHQRGVRLQDVEREHIRAVLANSGWRVRGAGGAAERLGLKPTTLETRMAKLGLRRPGRA